MEICKGSRKHNKAFLIGNIYTKLNAPNDGLYMAVSIYKSKKNDLLHIESGVVICSANYRFYEFADVTDKWCLIEK